MAVAVRSGSVCACATLSLKDILQEIKNDYSERKGVMFCYDLLYCTVENTDKTPSKNSESVVFAMANCI